MGRAGFVYSAFAFLLGPIIASAVMPFGPVFITSCSFEWPKLPSREVKDQPERGSVTFKHLSLSMNFCELKSVRCIAYFEAPKLP